MSEISIATESLDITLENDVMLAAKGDQQAFARLVDTSSKMVNSIALAIVKDFQAAEDIAQEVFLNAWAHLNKLRNPTSFLPWLRQTTRNRANSWIRDHIKQRDIEGRELLDIAADPRADQAAKLLADEEKSILFEVMDHLNDETREIVLLFYREEQSSKQVANLLGIGEPTVRKRLSRARQSLKESLLDKFANTATKSAPGAAFTGAILAGISLSGPSATAATVGTAATKAAATSGLSKFGVLLMSILPGLFAGLIGVIFGVQSERNRETDPAARQAWKMIGIFGCMTVVLAVGGFTWAGLAKSASIAIITQTFFSGSILFLFGIWGRRLANLRRDREIAKNPDFAKRHKWERIITTFALLFGLTTSWITIIFVLQLL